MPNIMTRSRRWLPVFLFLAAAGVLFFRARVFVGWGGGSEAALGALELRPPSAPGFGLVLMVVRLFGLLPFEGGVFGLNAAAAVMGAAGVGLLAGYLLRRGISPGLAVLAPLVLLSIPHFWDVCRDFSGAAVFLFFVMALYVWGGGPAPGSRRFLLFVLVVGLGATVHPGPVVLGVALVVAGVPLRELRRGAADATGKGLFIFAVAVSPLMFFWLRPVLDLNWGSSLSAALVGWGESGFGDWVVLVSDPAGIKRFLVEFGDAAVGSCLPVVLCLPLVFAGRSPRMPVVPILLFVPAFFVVFSLSPYRDIELALVLAVAAVCIVGVLGLERLARAARGKPARVAVAVCGLVVLVVPVVKGFSGEVFFEPDRSGDFAREVLERLPRDAVFIVRGGEDPLLNFAAVQRLEGRRPDVRVVYPGYFSSGGYRDFLRVEVGGGLAFPSEGEYVRASEEVMATALGVDGGMGKMMMDRMAEMTEVVIEEAVARENAAVREVYFSSVGHMVETRQMRGAGFVPEYYAFRFRPGGRAVFDVGKTLELAETSLRQDPVASEVMGRYFTDVGENFFKRRETPRAEEFLEVAAGLDPENPRAYFFLGLIHKEEGRYDEATGEFTKALRLLEARRGVGGLMRTTRVFMLARLYQELGISVEAEKLFEKIEK